MQIDHKHEWKRTKRIHKRPPRFFVKCASCGAESQAVIRNGFLHVFTTAYKVDPRLVKKVRSVRLSDADMEAIAAGKLRLIIRDFRITIAV